MSASLCYTFNESSGMLGIQLAAPIVIEEHQGLGTLDYEIVDVHGNEIDTDSVVLVHSLSDHELGSYSVDRSNQDWRTSISCFVEIDFAAKASNLGIGSWPFGRCDCLKVCQINFKNKNII